MAFSEARFPVDIAYGATGGPEYSTDIVITQGGYEQRNANWLQARARYNVAHGVKTQVQLDALIAFFRARGGRADGFRFKDWTDYKVSSQVIGTGNASATAFQLVRTYTSGSIAEQRTITKPIASTLKVYFNSILQSASLYTLNDTTGLVTFTSAPANGVIIGADFEFDVPVRFDTDRLAVMLESYGSYKWTDIPLLEIRI